MSDWHELHDFLIETNICTEEEIALVTSINGSSLDTYEQMLYVRTGYRSLDQMD